jgi:hypothetical protein
MRPNVGRYAVLPGEIMSFVPKSRTFNGSVNMMVEPSEAFPLFSPVGEKRWVPDWKPDLLYPIGVDWEEGQLFCTREEYGDAIWLVSRLDRTNRKVLYYRFEPGRYVARIDVSVIPFGDLHSRAIIAYSFVGLSESGNNEIEGMSQRDYDEKMKRWSDWLETSLGQKGK